MSDDLVARGEAIAASGKHQSTVLDEVERFCGRFLAFPSTHCLTVVVLWIAHTWALSAFYVTPRLVIDSAEPNSGKTRALEVMALLTRAGKLTLSTTTAALYRRIAAAESQPPTVLQDEADAIFGRANKPENEDLRALSNPGYKRGATVDRCETVGKTIVVREFPVFAPVALAGLAGKMPATITSRAVTIHMRRRSPDEAVAEFRERDAALHAMPVRDRLEAWAVDNLSALEQCRPVMPDGVRDRQAEVWEALLAVADVAGGSWPEKARKACAHFVLQADPDALSFGVRLLRDVQAVFRERDRMFSTDVVAALVADEEAEWSNLWGKPLDQNRLAKELKRYGVRSNTIRIGEGRAKGYQIGGEDGLAEAWHRYLPPIGLRDMRDTGDFADQPVTPLVPVTASRDNGDSGVTAETSPDVDLFDSGTPGTLVTAQAGQTRSTATTLTLSPRR